MITADKIFKSIKSIYSTNRTAFDKYYNKRKDVDMQLKECCKGTRLTENYYRDLRANLFDVREACNIKLEEITNSTKESLESVLEVARKEFRSFSSKQLDHDTIELLKADIMTVAELEELAKDFATNRTMTRIIGKAIADKAGASASGDIKEKIAVMTESSNQILNAITSVIDFTLQALGGYKPLNKTDTAYNRQENDGADVAMSLQENYYNTIEPIIKDALAVEIMSNYKGASSDEILNEINNNAFYQQIQQERTKEADAIATAKAEAEEKRKKALESSNDFERIIENADA